MKKTEVVAAQADLALYVVHTIETDRKQAVSNNGAWTPTEMQEAFIRAAQYFNARGTVFA